MFYYFILFYFIYCYFIAMSILYRLYRLQRLLQHAYNTKIFELSASIQYITCAPLPPVLKFLFCYHLYA